MYIATGIRSNNNHLTCFSTGYKAIHHIFYMSTLGPDRIGLPHTMQKIQDRIFFLFILFKTLWQKNGISTL